MLDGKHYWLRNAHVPASLIVGGTKWTARKQPVDNLLSVDIEIEAGAIAAITTAGTFSSYNVPSIDLSGGMVWPCFVDLHTHLDKGHIWPRATNVDGTFDAALKACIKDASKNWKAADVYRRFEFGLKCSYAHGTQAIRTHIDSGGKQGAISFEVLDQLREEWQGRITLQAVSLAVLDNYLTKSGEKLANLVAEKGGILGGVAYQNPNLEAEIDRTFELAKERNLDLDFHVDETGDPESRCLSAIAQATIKHRYKGRVVCGHCCSLAVQPEAEAKETIALVKKAGIGIVSLPRAKTNPKMAGRDAAP
jgi:cytosine/creatinine deaminase